MVKKTRLQRRRMATSALTAQVKEFTKPDQGDEASAINQLLVAGNDEWREEFKQTSLAWRELKRCSEKFDIEDPFWADLSLKDAIEQVEAETPDDEVDVLYFASTYYASRR